MKALFDICISHLRKLKNMVHKTRQPAGFVICAV